MKHNRFEFFRSLNLNFNNIENELFEIYKAIHKERTIEINNKEFSKLVCNQTVHNMIHNLKDLNLIDFFKLLEYIVELEKRYFDLNLKYIENAPQNVIIDCNNNKECPFKKL